jgi:hypothetical protein
MGGRLAIEERAAGFSLEPATSRARCRLEEDALHPRIFALAQRLLVGEIVDFTDRRGRTWRGTASTLAVVQESTKKTGPVLTNVTAFDVAAELVALELDDS